MGEERTYRLGQGRNWEQESGCICRQELEMYCSLEDCRLESQEPLDPGVEDCNLGHLEVEDTGRNMD